MLELSGDLRFLPEAPEVCGHRHVEHELQGDVTVQARVESSVHDPHSAAPELGLDPIFTELRAERRQLPGVGPLVGLRLVPVERGPVRLRLKRVVEVGQPVGPWSPRSRPWSRPMT